MDHCLSSTPNDSPLWPRACVSFLCIVCSETTPLSPRGTFLSTARKSKMRCKRKISTKNWFLRKRWTQMWNLVWSDCKTWSPSGWGRSSQSTALSSGHQGGGLHWAGIFNLRWLHGNQSVIEECSIISCLEQKIYLKQVLRIFNCFSVRTVRTFPARERRSFSPT